MLYIIEIKHNYNTNYSKHKMYLKDFGHIVVNRSEATKYKKGNLSKIYKKLGRENVIVHKVKEN